MPVVAEYGKEAVCSDTLWQTGIKFPDVVIAGAELTVIVKLVGAVDTHPAALLTVNDPV
ncbi:hypothetical protein D3C80_1030040 [compost metagenome]